MAMTSFMENPQTSVPETLSFVTHDSYFLIAYDMTICDILS